MGVPDAGVNVGVEGAAAADPASADPATVFRRTLSHLRQRLGWADRASSLLAMSPPAFRTFSTTSRLARRARCRRHCRGLCPFCDFAADGEATSELEFGHASILVALVPATALWLSAVSTVLATIAAATTTAAAPTWVTHDTVHGAGGPGRGPSPV